MRGCVVGGVPAPVGEQKRRLGVQLICNALVLCKKVLDNDKGGPSAIGLIRGFNAPAFPFVPDPVCEAYMELWGGQGPVGLRLRIASSDGTFSHDKKFNVDLGVSGHVTAYCLELTDLEFPRAGDYRVTLWHDEMLVAHKMLPVEPLGASD